MATELITDGDRPRTFPSSGLDPIEMARAIKGAGLEVYPVRVSSEYVLKQTVYAYLRARIPIIFGFELVEEIKENAEEIKENAEVKDKIVTRGKHAVAITGYSLDLKQVNPYGKTGFLLRASRIDKLFVHDDQIGPFAPMDFDGREIEIKSLEGFTDSVPTMSTLWPDKLRAVPTLVMIPLYHKIRIKCGLIHDMIVEFDTGLKFISHNRPESCPSIDALEWDIFLTTVNEFKSSIFESNTIIGARRKEILSSCLPKYLWRATAFSNDCAVLDLLFDATDIEQGKLFLGAIEYIRPLEDYMRAAFEQPAMKEPYSELESQRIIQWFLTPHSPWPR